MPLSVFKTTVMANSLGLFPSFTTSIDSEKNKNGRFALIFKEADALFHKDFTKAISPIPSSTPDKDGTSVSSDTS